MNKVKFVIFCAICAVAIPMFFTSCEKPPKPEPPYDGIVLNVVEYGTLWADGSGIDGLNVFDLGFLTDSIVIDEVGKITNTPKELIVRIATLKNNGTELPTGHFELNGSIEAETVLGTDENGSWTYAYHVVNQDSTTFYGYSSGYADISKTEKGYLVDMVFTTEDNVTHKYRYEGVINCFQWKPTEYGENSYDYEPTETNVFNLTGNAYFFSYGNYQTANIRSDNYIVIINYFSTQNVFSEYPFNFTYEVGTAKASRGVGTNYDGTVTYDNSIFVLLENGSENIYFIKSGTFTLAETGWSVNAITAHGSEINISGAYGQNSPAKLPNKQKFSLGQKSLLNNPRGMFQIK
ncbi:MAG: hypothetical protein LBN95_05115 [Prevotellaceae bacterium]|jgi:hypothetical protein|nr:hypothetical protein [Prevotellaceae bacterium]